MKLILNVTHKRKEQALMPRKMDTSVILSIKDKTGNVSLLYTNHPIASMNHALR